MFQYFFDLTNRASHSHLGLSHSLGFFYAYVLLKYQTIIFGIFKTKLHNRLDFMHVKLVEIIANFVQKLWFKYTC